ncbi:peptidase C45 acyl-coenzyme A:6-aminopenicillanic acid acyl-transferase [Isosphaera pallida ATCC 43644]|uniref:Peptidase C45 acyl-coenzyme A:6-aminopenicillanic acid acyl-transferase n=1 Tax=Isosphaera pallida (strain ATCC 43644 / DSM 9630 / IS1B) TaxID=575540 RepID=E8QYD4_ISOPI|nr:C45 family peptidase [Isosphaera pallida]ADV63129.1 peptidase C45 acyl-coenzyme A:6-aminopenicillanic acid acyl-transferase [Isosphaera pallida ATCC 43644]
MLFRFVPAVLVILAALAPQAPPVRADEPNFPPDQTPRIIGADGATTSARLIARHGKGFLEEINGYRILHLEGSPYDMGVQHGALLKDEIREQVRFLFDVKAKELDAGIGPFKVDPYKVILGISKTQQQFVPQRFYDELRGVADGSGLPYEDIVVANFLPELFHCSGFALTGSATRDGAMYHGRLLDYGCDWRLQEHAVLVVAKPEGKIPFVNVTYAGFVGSVTGMNAEKVSIGEMGGAGLGHWDGVPMAFLVRMALEEADGLDQAVAIFRDHPRTCEYYYVIADGQTHQAVGMEASWNAFSTVKLGESHPKLPEAVADAVLLSAGDRYTELVRRVRAQHGAIDVVGALKLMNRPVAMKSNLHAVLFETNTTRFWVANASIDGQPAAHQPYYEFKLADLLTRTPETLANTSER